MQGYYFTFASLIASQIFFELGFNYVITQIVAHESIGVKLNESGHLNGDKKNVDRIYSLLKLVRRLYLFIAISFFTLLTIIGVKFFSTQGALDLSTWMYPWLMHVFFTSIIVFLGPYMAVVEGFGRVAEVAKLRLFQSIVGYSLFFALMVLGYDLYAVPAVSCSYAIFGLVWLLKKYKVWLLGLQISCKYVISWRKEIFPFQWKIALSWISGYFIFQLFTPLLFANQSADVAGAFGLSMSIYNTMLGLAMGWVTAKSPLMGKYIAEKKRVKLNRLFKSIIFKSAVLNIITGLSFIVFVYILKINGFSLVDRILPIDSLIILMFISVVNQLVFSMAAYMRAHKEEPMLLNSICVAVLVAFSVYFLSYVSAYLVLIGYLCILVLIALPWTYFIFKRYFYE
ncbi:hypothetical protein N5P32_00545 [Marinomonas pontica]|uniref:hypothetical protein n=1 Tax=Marinomonas pontica TaxID=264739 RepID=UPI002244249F|nr:hypothetical protein [Marinomonas pontica]MCW8354479.1 hypothetical protein [Marinomonas pontica]